MDSASLEKFIKSSGLRNYKCPFNKYFSASYIGKTLIQMDYSQGILDA